MWGTLMKGMLSKMGGGGDQVGSSTGSMQQMQNQMGGLNSDMFAMAESQKAEPAETSWGSLLGAQGGLGTKGQGSLTSNYSPATMQQGFMGDRGAAQSGQQMLPSGYKDVSQWANPGTLMSYIKNMPQTQPKPRYKQQGYESTIMGGYL